MYLTISLLASDTYLSRGWNLPNLGDREPSVMISLKAHTEPPTQYWIVASDLLLAAVDLDVFECHSNIE